MIVPWRLLGESYIILYIYVLYKRSCINLISPTPLKTNSLPPENEWQREATIAFIFGAISAYFSGANLLLSFRFRVIPILVVE